MATCFDCKYAETTGPDYTAGLPDTIESCEFITDEMWDYIERVNEWPDCLADMCRHFEEK